MLFRQMLVIEEPSISASTPIVLHAGAGQKVEVALRPMRADERDQFDGKTSWFAIPQVEREPSERLRAEFTAHTARLAEQGESKAIPITAHEVPRELSTHSDRVSRELHDAAVTVLRVMRWRLGLFGSHNPVRSTRGCQYSIDGTSWNPLPTSIRAFSHSYVMPDITSNVIAELESLLRAGAEEPIAHALLREAWQQRHTNPRSALLVGVAALEVGVKSVIATLLPQTKWLLENMPSPSVEKLLRDFVPMVPLPPQISSVSIPKAILEQVKKAVQIRNLLAHAGTATIDLYFLDDLLREIRNLLRLFDVIAGNKWAAAYVEGELGKIFLPKV